MVTRTLYAADNTYGVSYGSLTPQEQARIEAEGFYGIDPQFATTVDPNNPGTKQIILYPTPAATTTYTFRYISLNWLRSATSSATQEDTAEAPDTPQFYDRIHADTDIPIIDPHLIQLDVIWRFRNLHGLEYFQEMEEYNQYYASIISADAAEPDIIPMSRPQHVYPHYNNARIRDYT